MDVAIANTNTMLPLAQRPTELGRIRLGDKAETKEGKEYPVKLETWRLTSGSRAYLEAAAELYGGKVKVWEDAPDEGTFELLTQSRELRVLIPRDLRTLTQSYELWQGGTCERRCDSVMEQFTAGPCLCDPADRECDPRTRLSIMLPDVPGLGTWRLDTGGYHAATTLPATIELLKNLSEKPWIPAVLRLEQRSKKKRGDDGKVTTHRFAVPVLDLPGITVGKVVARMGNAPAVQIEAEAPAAPQTARERVAQQRAVIEAQITDGADPDGPTGREADVPPLPAAPDDAGAPAAIQQEPPAGDADQGATAEPAGTIPATSASDLGKAGAEDGEAANGPAAAPQRCEGFSDEYGACQREPGHTANHRAKSGESWK